MRVRHKHETAKVLTPWARDADPNALWHIYSSTQRPRLGHDTHLTPDERGRFNSGSPQHVQELCARLAAILQDRHASWGQQRLESCATRAMKSTATDV